MKEAKTNGNLLALAGTGAGTQEVVGGEIFALPYLQSIYRNPMEPTTVRMRAAIECLPFENPKLSATAVATMDGLDFAAALDRCIERSGIKKPTPLPPPKQIEARPEPVTAEEMKKPFQRYRRF